MSTMPDIDFCTLGMFILDDIYPRKTDPDQSPKINVIGGAGTYSAIGARLFCPPSSSSGIGWIVDAGTDFPDHVRHTINSWQTGVLLRPRDALTTRGWNAYTQDEHRAFKYLTEKKRITAEDLTVTLVSSKSFHMICSASRCTTLVNEILDRRKTLDLPRPLFIWEPVPDLCTPAELEAIKVALHHVDVISPNHEELSTIFDSPHPPGVVDRELVRSQAEALLEAGARTVVVRCGKDGVFACCEQERHFPGTTNDTLPVGADRDDHFWIPAYHTEQRCVIDPTGGGNGFLGGFAIGIAAGESLQKAVAMGSIAASFCIEQVGPPTLHRQSEPEPERWNNDVVQQRLDRFMQRIDHA